MGSKVVRWTLNAGRASVLLIALPLFPLAVTDSSVVQAAEKSDLLDHNTATAEQLKALHLTRAGELGVRLLKEPRERSPLVVKRTGIRGSD